MRFPSTLIVLLAAAGHALAGVAYPPPGNATANRVAYFQDNDPAGVAIVALQISDEDGTLSNPVRTLTGGKGLLNLLAVSVNSVTVRDNYIFTTNAGDDTVSMLVIDPKDPLHPKLVGSPAPTLGDTPLSVAYSEKLQIACALNGGANAGAACFSVDGNKGLTPLGGLRSVPVPVVNPNLPPKPASKPLAIAPQIVFNPASTALFFTTGAANAVSGHIYAYPIKGSEISTTAVVSEFLDLTGVFSLNFLDHSGTRLITTNPIVGAPGAAFLEVDAGLHVKNTKTITLPHQLAACWVAYAPRFDNLYIADAKQANFTVVSASTGEVKSVVQFDSFPGTGGEENAILKDHLYGLTDDPFSPRIDVWDLGKQGVPVFVQSFDIFTVVGKIPAWQGLDVWPKYKRDL